MSTTTIAAGTYNVDRVHSSIGFGVKYNGLATFRSTFDDYTASYEDGVLTGTVKVESIQVDEPNFKGHLMTADFFNAEETPEITFTSTDVRIADDGSAEVDGDLTIRGETRPVTATGTAATGVDPYGNERVAFELEAKVDRREFGLAWQNELPNGGDAVAWEVTLKVDLQLVKA